MGLNAMRLAIMQPYFLPYIGYYQLIAAVDLFVIYDNIKYTKKGWINRNRFLHSGQDKLFTLPLKKDSDMLDIVQRELAADFDRVKLLNQLRGAYYQAPYFEQIFPLVEDIVRNPEQNLFRYIYSSIITLCAYLDIKTKIAISSEITIDHGLRSQKKVIALCEALGADTYINSSGGVSLYDPAEFRAHGLQLRFLKARSFTYLQFEQPFVPWLSIVDVLMFNPRDSVMACIAGNFTVDDYV